MKRSILAGLILLLALCLVSTAAAQAVEVYVQSNPGGADVSVDDNTIIIGTTNHSFSIEAGQHTLYLSKVGYKPYSSPIGIQDVEFIALGVITLEPLPPATGGINVVTIPPNATVSIKHTGDGDSQYFPLGKAPLTFSSLIAGDYTVKLELAGYYPLTRNIIVTSGNMTEIVAELVKIPTTGFAEFKTVPPGASVFIGGSFVGTTPLTLELARGIYPYTFRLDGFRDNSSTFDIEAGETTPVEATLEKVFQNVSVYFNPIPSGAEIFIDGSDTGLVTPSVIPIPYNPNGSNSHTIKFTKTGFKDFGPVILDLNSWFANLDPLYQFQDVTMEPLTITICSNLTNGTITPADGDYNVTFDQVKRYEVQGATSDWEITDIVVKNIDTNSVTILSPPLDFPFNSTEYLLRLDSVISNFTLCAHFVRYNVTVNASAGPGGSINPSDIFKVPIGSTPHLVITPQECYDITGLIANGQFQEWSSPDVYIPSIDTDWTIQALFTLQTYTVNATSIGGGTVSVSPSQPMNCGGTATVQIAPNNEYMVQSVIDNETSVIPVPTGDYVIPNVMENHDVVVTFIPAEFTITSSIDPLSTGTGTIEPFGDNIVPYGGNLKFNITPGPCSAILNVKKDGNYTTDYNFTNVTADHTIVVNFSTHNPDIIATAGPGGIITPNGTQPVDCHEDLDFDLIPDSCYMISEVKINGTEIPLNDPNLDWGDGPIGGQGVNATYTGFDDVTSDQTIDVEFEIATFTVTTIVVEDHGTITPNNETVPCGGDITLFFQAEQGFVVDQVFVEGDPYIPEPTDPPSITITNITGNITVKATFVTNAVADFEAVVQPVPEGQPIPLRFLDPIAQPGMDIKFYDLSTGEGIDQWRWDFGDGNYSALQNPIHKYGQTGLYTVSLKVHNAAGWSNPDVKIDYIEITENPLVDFSFVPVTGNVPPSLTVKFADETIDTTGTPHIITWDFGDGSVGPSAVGETTPMHTYTDYGTYVVTLNIDNIIGEGSMSKEIIITANPVANFIGFPTHGNHNLTVQFTDLSQAVVPLTTWFWNFGDGEFSTAKDPSHTYYTPGKYNVTLNVTTDIGTYNLTKKIFYIDVR